MRFRGSAGLAFFLTACARPHSAEQVGITRVDGGTVLATAEGGSPAKRKREWRIEAPRPTSRTLTGVWAASPTDLYAIGEGVVMHSDGSGQWTIRAQGKDVEGLNAIWGSSATDLYAVGQAGILHSSDGGARWSSRTPKTEGSEGYRAIWGSSADDIYVTGTETVHSTDRGKTWKEVKRASDAGRFGHVFGRSATDVWLVGAEHSAKPYSDALILHSSNAGKTWQVQRRDSNHRNGFAGFFANDKVVIALPALGDQMLRSTNGGRRWESVTIRGLSEDRGCALTGSGNELVLATCSGQIMRSTNAGSSWQSTGDTGVTERQIGQESLIEQLLLVGDSVYGVGFGGLVLRSRAGASWVFEAGSSLNKDLKGVWGTSSKNVYAVGDDGTIVRSTDEGTTWRNVAPPRKAPDSIAPRYASVWGSGPTDIYVVGANIMNALVLHSSDGATFTEQPASGGELVAVWGSDADHVFAAGMHEILRTTDHGASWRSVWSDASTRLTSISGGGGSIWATGWKQGPTPKGTPSIFESSDHGASWHELQGKPPSEHLNAIRWTKRGTLVGVGYGPKIHRSVDRGATWTEEPIAFDGYMETLGGDDDEIFAAGYNGALFQGTQDGKQWVRIDVGLDWTRAIHGVWTSPEGDVFAVGDVGIVVHRR